MPLFTHVPVRFIFPALSLLSLPRARSRQIDSSSVTSASVAALPDASSSQSHHPLADAAFAISFTVATLDEAFLSPGGWPSSPGRPHRGRPRGGAGPSVDPELVGPAASSTKVPRGSLQVRTELSPQSSPIPFLL
jgi:hypothetical protein